jgi:hypothetical protein
MDYEIINTIRTHVRKILKEVKVVNEDNELINAVKGLISIVETMSCIPNDDTGVGDSGHWYGEFTEYEENYDDGEVIIEWPNLTICVEKIKKILDKLASQ